MCCKSRPVGVDFLIPQNHWRGSGLCRPLGTSRLKGNGKAEETDGDGGGGSVGGAGALRTETRHQPAPLGVISNRATCLIYSPALPYL